MNTSRSVAANARSMARLFLCALLVSGAWATTIDTVRIGEEGISLRAHRAAREVRLADREQRRRHRHPREGGARPTARHLHLDAHLDAHLDTHSAPWSALVCRWQGLRTALLASMSRSVPRCTSEKHAMQTLRS